LSTIICKMVRRKKLTDLLVRNGVIELNLLRPTTQSGWALHDEEIECLSVFNEGKCYGVKCGRFKQAKN